MIKNIETTPIAINVVSNKYTQANLTLTVNGIDVCHILLEKEKKDPVKDTIYAFDLSEDAKELILSGTYDYYYSHFDKWKSVSGNQKFKILDMAPIMQTLRETSRPFGQRLLDFKKAVLAFEKHYPKSKAMYLPSTYFELGKGAPDSMIKAAEQRLGFNLPTEHIDLLRKVNYFDFGDSGSEPVERINTAYNQMIDPLLGWGTSEETLEEFPADLITFLKSSVILYTEVGDGLGAVIYHPAHNDQGAYYWFHQDGDMYLFKNRDGSCKNYTEMMIYLFANHYFSHNDFFYHGFHRAGDNTNIVLVDRSTPKALTLNLNFPSERPLPNGNWSNYDEEAHDWLGFQFDLYIAWDKFEECICERDI